MEIIKACWVLFWVCIKPINTKVHVKYTIEKE